MIQKNNDIMVNFIGTDKYPKKVPFNPPEEFPELDATSVDPENQVYKGVRDILIGLGLDSDNFGSVDWNPLGEIIKPGMTVFIKPNLVRQSHLEGKDVFSVIVHASVLRPILDYVSIALKNQGKIIIGNSQPLEAQFDKACEVSQFDGLLKWYRNQTPVNIECFDLRLYRNVRTWLYGKWGKRRVEEDPLGYTFVNLSEDSCFKGIDPKKLRIAVGNYKTMIEHHSNGKHEYLFPNSFLNSDVVINLPKLKTHRRTAVSMALKNFMGLPALKDSLPHFMVGSSEEGGDHCIYRSLRKTICTRLNERVWSSKYIPMKFIYVLVQKAVWSTRKVVPFKDNVIEGMWPGNDTLWRTIIDLNRVALYADKEGKIQNIPQRSFFSVIDGIVAGAGKGPSSPDPVQAGVLLAGFNPVALDIVGSTLVGFNIEKIPMIRKSLESTSSRLPLFKGNVNSIRVLENEDVFNVEEYGRHRNLRFEAHPNWKGIIERNSNLQNKIG
jgi:uncharacterized protein (DUF362 family)